MRKILTFQIFKLERRDAFASYGKWKSQGFVEKRSKIFFTSRREIFTNPWLFSALRHLVFAPKVGELWKFHLKSPRLFVISQNKFRFWQLYTAIFASKDKARKIWAILGQKNQAIIRGVFPYFCLNLLPGSNAWILYSSFPKVSSHSCSKLGVK